MNYYQKMRREEDSSFNRNKLNIIVVKNEI
jgi:hypothetical protein